MNHKRSRNSNKFSLRWKNGKVTSSTDRNPKQSDSIPQITPLHQPLWFWRHHSQWSYFGRGLFWGGLVSLTSICSAMGGVALTSIDFVEQQISQQLQKNSDESALQLTTPLQILLVEVEPDRDAVIGFTQSQDESKNILLLEVEPELQAARVINIPRDTRVRIPEFGSGTVTDAYRLGGIELLSRSLARTNRSIKIDRYLRTSPDVFRQLSASGKINLPKCDRRLKECLVTEQIVLQQTAFETIRQRLNIPSYLANFQTAIAKVEPELDTNISMPELTAVANFIGELEPDRLSVELLPEYTLAGKNKDGLLSTPKHANPEINLGQIPKSDRLLRSKPIAVQNTTDNPELGRRVVAYLRSRNFSDVYLVRHIPLKLEQTRIVTNYAQVETANYLKNILGVGNLDAKSSQQPHLVLQLGEDALYLP